MTEVYFGIALAALIVFGMFKYIENRKNKKNRDSAPPMSDPLPPTPVETDEPRGDTRNTGGKGTNPR